MCPHGIAPEKYCPGCARRFSADDDSITCGDDNSILLPITRDPLIGRLVDEKFEVLDLIGAGGSSMVYRAHQVELDRPVAFKLLRTDLVSSAEKIQRFGTEARLASRLVHRNICRIYDFGITNNGQPYLVMEIVEGKSLNKVLNEEGSMSVARAINLTKQIGEGLQEAHRSGIIHRDLKPSNIMVMNTGDVERVKLIDFGLAKTLDLDKEEQVASSGYMVGTPSYMSPEQVLGQTMDVRTDIYSLGCVLFEMLCGKKAVDGTTAFEIMSKHVQSDVQQRIAEGGIPLELQEFISRCLAKEPQRRYQTIQEALDVLTAIESESGSFRGMMRGLRLRMSPAPMAVAIVAAIAVPALLIFNWQNLASHSSTIPLNDRQMAARLVDEFKAEDAKNNNDKAEAAGKKAFAWMQQNGQADTPEMIALCRQMQKLYVRQMRTQHTAPYIKAAFDAQYALAMQEPEGKQDLSLIEAYKDAGNNYYLNNFEAEAQPYLTKWLELVEKKYGVDSKESAEPLMSLCRSNLWCGNFKDSSKYFQHLAKVCEKQYAPDDEFRLGVMREGIDLYSQMGDYKEAARIADQTVALLPKAPFDLQAQALEAAAHVAAAARDYPKAIKLVDEAVAAWIKWDDRASLGRQDKLLVMKSRYLREIKKYKEAQDVAKVAVRRISRGYTDSVLYKWALDEYIRALREGGSVTEADAVRRAGKILPRH